MLLYPDINCQPLTVKNPSEHVAKPYHLIDSGRKSQAVQLKVKWAKDARRNGLTIKKIAEMLEVHHTTIVHYLNYYVK
jgi:fatty acid-binding protein DegV